ncbi:MAG: DM13 domain-containing protein [Pseudomonadota bacterium]
MNISRRQFAGLAGFVAASAALGAAPAFAGGKTRTGALSGRRGYNVAGSVSVTTKNGATTVSFANDYVFDPSKNPPDIKIGFGSGESYAKGSKIHEALTVKQGAASFDVPAGIDTSKYDELYIYCEQFSVILAVAPLN